MLTKNQALKQFRMAVSLFFFVQGAVFTTWANRIPDIKKALRLNDAELGNVLFGMSTNLFNRASNTQGVNMHTGLAVATVSSIGYLSFLVGPPIIRHVSHAISLHYTFAVIACVGLLVAVGASRLPIHTKQ